MTTSVLIPAHNEAAYLPQCLEAVLASDPPPDGMEVIVVANGCTDNTADIARGFIGQFATRGWALTVLDLAEGGKLNAWNKGEFAAKGTVLVYLDADVQVAPPLIAGITEKLLVAAPRYASGRPNVTTGTDPLIRAYTRFWKTTPFMVHGVPGFGVFAMNRAGRARWTQWPDIISDDTFARLNFAPSERLDVQASYDWPMINSFGALVLVRRRQDAGVAEVAQLFPTLMANDDPHTATQPFAKRALADPIGCAVFCALRLAVKLPLWRSTTRWARGR